MTKYILCKDPVCEGGVIADELEKAQQTITALKVGIVDSVQLQNNLDIAIEALNNCYGRSCDYCTPVIEQALQDISPTEHE